MGFVTIGAFNVPVETVGVPIYIGGVNDNNFSIRHFNNVGYVKTEDKFGKGKYKSKSNNFIVKDYKYFVLNGSYRLIKQ